MDVVAEPDEVAEIAAECRRLEIAPNSKWVRRTPPRHGRPLDFRTRREKRRSFVPLDREVFTAHSFVGHVNGYSIYLRREKGEKRCIVLLLETIFSRLRVVGSPDGLAFSLFCEHGDTMFGAHMLVRCSFSGCL